MIKAATCLIQELRLPHRDGSVRPALRFRVLLLRLPFLLAALWSIGTGISLLPAPLYSGFTVTTRDTDDQIESIEQASTMILVEANGDRVIGVLLIFAVLFCAAAVCAVQRRYMLTTCWQPRWQSSGL